MTTTRSLKLASYLICGLLCVAFMSSMVASDNIVTKKSNTAKLITINEDDWEQMLVGEWMVEFHAPWCPACRALQPEWKTFSGWSTDLGIKVGAVDVTANPGLSGRFLVTALPTIYHVKDGVFRQYRGTRDTNSFVSFVEEKKWQTIEPVTTWKSPDSVQMSFVSHLFKISMALRSVHNSLVEDYGIPYWGSYIVFAFATILFGAILGLLIVCVIDVIWPAKLDQPLYKEVQKTQESDAAKAKDSDQDLEEDDMVTDSDDQAKSSGPEEEAPASQSEPEQTDSDQAATKGIRKRKPRRVD